MIPFADVARMREFARATHALIDEVTDGTVGDATSLAVLADLVAAWTLFDDGRPLEAEVRLTCVVERAGVAPTWRFLAHAGRGLARRVDDRPSEAREDLAAAAAIGIDDARALASVLDVLAELEHRAGDHSAAYRHLRAARTVESSERLDGAAVVDLTDRAVTLGQLVKVREQQLERALIDLRDERARGEIDELTGLANRRRLRVALGEIVSGRGHCAVMAIDLDRFGRVNETLGHTVGDEFLTEMARRLQEIVRDVDVVGRWGGDEFVIVVPGVREVDAAVGLADSIRQSVSVPWAAGDGRSMTPSVSIGVAVGADGEVAPDDLLRHADAALERAKATGKNRVEVFGIDIGEAAHRRFEVERLIRTALDHELFELYYQPVHSNQPGYPLAAEALLRLHHPDGRLLAPGAFLDIAEETGLARPMGSWVLRSACATASSWQKLGESFRCAINVSAGQLDDEFPDLVGAALDRYGLPADTLVLELTEHVLLAADATQVDALERVRAMGVRIALDDFGTAYSSLTHLRRFPVDVVKIDRSFVEGMTHNAGDAAIISAVVDLSRTFNFRVVAEGIETAQQLDVQQQLGCHGAQGFLIGRPKPAAAFAELLSTRVPLGRMVGLVA